MPSPTQFVSSWRMIPAGILDILTIMVPLAFVIPPYTATLTWNDLEISGLHALAWPAMIALYFIISNHMGGTIWERILKTGSSDTTNMAPADHPAGLWRIMLAGVLDTLTIILPSTYALAHLTGNLIGKGLELSGIHALAWLAITAAYFVIGKRTGGTIWDRILEITSHDSTIELPPDQRVAQWRITAAGVLDLLTIALPTAYVVAHLTGNVTEDKLSVSGWGAWLWLAIIVAYFVIGKRTGGTIWERVLKTHSIRR